VTAHLTKLDLILSTITDGILVVDTRGVVLYANQAAETLLGRGPMIGHSLAIPVNADKNSYLDINLIRPSGLAWAEMRSTPLEWDGQPGYVIGLRDITDRKLTEMALQEREALFHTLAKVAPVGIFHTDPKGQCEYVNERWCEITGLSAEEAKGEGWTQAIYSEDKDHVFSEWHKTALLERPFAMQYRFQSPDGHIHWVVGQAEAERDATGTVLGYVGTVTDISSLKLNEQRLRQAAAVFESTREGVMITDAERRITMVNRAFTDITGYEESETIGNTPSMLRSGRHNAAFYHTMWATILATGHWQGEIWNRRKTGEVYPELLSISAVKNEDGNITHYVAVFADISKLKASEMELEFLAHHDPLTQLPNRMLLISRLEHGLEKALRDSKLLAVLMLDLDRFKDVNDSFGHLAGDELLQQVAERLSLRLRGTDTVCRLGGDEFTVLLEEINHPEAAARIATEIISALSEPWQLSNGIDVRIGVSVGISLYPDHGTTPEALMQHADTALYQAKNEGRNRFKYFSEELTRVARERMDLEWRLRQAVDKGELQIYFQPQINIADGRIIGAEALLRWHTNGGDLISPRRFIPIAEETGLISSIGAWVLRETCLIGKRWQEAGRPELRLAVNVSPNQFLYGDISETVADILAETDFPARYLELEITETALMKREAEAIEILTRLHGMGIRLAIDDFGTGYSSLAYLKMFPVDVLKIDKSFIDDIPNQRDDMEITATIIAMAKTLRMKVLAEGVENHAQLDFLKTQDCDFYQGYITSPPLPIKDFEHFWQQHCPSALH
jgi:diguanylate cyclase (GGDEF)-like protein/PAS domain S-box-containing protein